jgi:uncharacterized protein (TIGR03067 family)
MNPLLVTLALTVAAPGLKDSPKKDTNPLLGNWVVKKIEISGLPFPVPDGGLTVEFTADGKAVYREGTKPPDPADYTANPKKDPAEIDLTPPTTPGKVPRMIGIYKIEGDILTVCLVTDGERPTKFGAPAAGEVQIVMIFERSKKD